MNVKKFVQDKAKKIKYQKYLKQNKQNLYSVCDDSKFKQFSVDLHKLSMDQQLPNRNIIKQEISIFLQSQSQNKTFNQRYQLENQIKKLTKKLDQNNGCIKQFLDSELQESDQIKTDQIRKLVGVLVKKLTKSSFRTSHSSAHPVTNPSAKTSVRSKYCSNTILSQSTITPYLKQQIETMQQKLQQLQAQNIQYKEYKNIQKSQKQYIRHTLQTVYKRQLQQVQKLEDIQQVF